MIEHAPVGRPKGPAGLLEVEGKIDLAQFWPTGLSEADTAHVLVDVQSDSFRFRAREHEGFEVTHAFENAHVKGQGTKLAIRRGQVVVRLQGLDAPELHFRPQWLGHIGPVERQLYNAANASFRQNYAEAATVSLAAKLKEAGGAIIDCVVRTAVDSPGEVFDVYGRMIADIHVTIGGRDLNVNRWLVERGWAFPSYYASMSADEIEILDGLAKIAREKPEGVWKGVSRDARPFDATLIFRAHGPVQADDGDLVMPKIFRRRAAYHVARTAEFIGGSFDLYLREHPDQCRRTSEFLHSGNAARTHRLDQFVAADSQLKFWPQDLVFSERASYLLDENGAPVQSF